MVLKINTTLYVRDFLNLEPVVDMMGTVMMVTVDVVPMVVNGSVTGDEVEGFIVDDIILLVMPVIGSVTVIG